MAQYLVRWEIDAWASTPAEAALQALDAQRRPDSTATVFDVVAQDGTITRVDLDEEDS